VAEGENPLVAANSEAGALYLRHQITGAVMQSIINQCAGIFAKASEEAHSQIVGAAAELARVEGENDRLRDALRVAIEECSNGYFWSGKAQVAADLLGVDVSEFGASAAPANYASML
jgi:hypothetical protein